jgi:AraC family transcriptional regulator
LEENNIIQHVLDIIDNRITERRTLHELAEESGYSTSHLNRLFSGVTGITLMAYVTRRKLQYALYDLSCGERIIDIALKYGFETHAGFTKAFKKCFGYSPSLYRIHAIIGRPARMEINELISNISGGKIMYPVIMEIQPFTVVGFTSRHTMPDVRFTHDIPVYYETINMNYWEPLTRLHNLFNKSRHTEYTVCFDIDPLTSEFTYLLGVGVDNPEDYS